MAIGDGHQREVRAHVNKEQKKILRDEVGNIEKKKARQVYEAVDKVRKDKDRKVQGGKKGAEISKARRGKK